MQKTKAKLGALLSEYSQKAYVFNIVNAFFQDVGKTGLWMNSKNSMLGDVSPIDMICMGRIEKLLSFIETSLSENKS